MGLVLGIVVGLVLGVLSLAVDRRWGWRVGTAVAVVYTAVVGVLVATTELSMLTASVVLVASSVPSLVAGAVGDARKPPRGLLRPR